MKKTLETRIKMAEGQLKAKVKKMTKIDEEFLAPYKKALVNIWADKNGNIIKVYEYEGDLYYKPIEPSITNSGYLQVGRPDGGAIGVHTLVMMAWVGLRPEGMDINHKDHNRFNNSLDNLEYIPISENRRNTLPQTKYTYYGRYWESTGYYTAPNGTKIKMTPEEYIEYVRITRGNGIANKIAKARMQRRNKEEK